ncbi:hypothetical protein AC739_06930 [Planococcus glaciei]|nr:hypothetical protein AC739_06930 [Planococcus glaciei]
MCSSFSGCRQSLDEAYSDAYNQPDRPLRFPWAQPQSPRRFAPAGPSAFAGLTGVSVAGPVGRPSSMKKVIIA